jgi:hypothetical protein
MIVGWRREALAEGAVSATLVIWAWSTPEVVVLGADDARIAVLNEGFSWQGAGDECIVLAIWRSGRRLSKDARPELLIGERANLVILFGFGHPCRRGEMATLLLGRMCRI